MLGLGKILGVQLKLAAHVEQGNLDRVKVTFSQWQRHGPTRITARSMIVSSVKRPRSSVKLAGRFPRTRATALSLPLRMVAGSTDRTAMVGRKPKSLFCRVPLGTLDGWYSTAVFLFLAKKPV